MLAVLRAADPLPLEPVMCTTEMLGCQDFFSAFFVCCLSLIDMYRYNIQCLDSMEREEQRKETYRVKIKSLRGSKVCAFQITSRILTKCHFFTKSLFLEKNQISNEDTCQGDSLMY